MALLQISEPGMSAAPHQHRLAVGIDLGTTNSLVATVRSGLSTVLADEHGHSLLPSVVHYAAEDAIEVGFDAQKKQNQDPHNTIVSVKRFMGRGLKDIDASQLPYQFSESDLKADTAQTGMLQIETRAGVKSSCRNFCRNFKSIKSACRNRFRW